MRVAVFPENDGGTGRYRLRYPATYAARDGADVEILTELAPTWQGDGVDKRCHHVPVDADVLVLQRCLEADYLPLIDQAQAQGIAVVVDIDDDFEHLPTGHPGHQAWTGNYHPAHLMAACHKADLVTCSTPELAHIYAPHGRFMVLRNCVPSSFFSVIADRGPHLLVGWAGAIDSHVRDLASTDGAIRRALRGTDARFGVIGDDHRAVAAELRLDPRIVGHTGWVHIDQYPDAYAKLDVAICPLALNTFNRSKSYLKPLEAAAMGVACVATDIGEYRLAGELGLCDTARTPTEWARKVRRLIDDPDHRAEQAWTQRDAARAHTYETNAWRWVEAWEQAAEFSTARRKAVT